MTGVQPLSFTLARAMDTCSRLVYHLVVGHRNGWSETATTEEKLTHAIKAVGTHRDLFLGILLHRAAERCLTADTIPSVEDLTAEACASVRAIWRESAAIRALGDSWLGDASASRPFLTEVVSGRGIRPTELDEMRHRLDDGLLQLVESPALADLRARPRAERLFVGERPRLMQLASGATGWLVPDAGYLVADGSALCACDADGVVVPLAPQRTLVLVDWKCGSLDHDRAREAVERQLRWYAALLAHGAPAGQQKDPLPGFDWTDMQFAGRAISLDDGVEHWFRLSPDQVQAAAREFGNAFTALQELLRHPGTHRTRTRAELPVLPPGRRDACGRCLYEMVCRRELSETASVAREPVLSAPAPSTARTSSWNEASPARANYYAQEAGREDQRVARRMSERPQSGRENL
jgi:hypothetical protein